MPLIGISIKLERIDEGLLYRDPGGGWWLSAVCTFDQDSKGRTVVAQSIPKERFAAGEKPPALGTWRDLGGGNHASGKPAFDLSKYKKPPAPEQKPAADQKPAQQEGPFPSPEAAFDAAQEVRREPNKPDDFEGF